VNAFIPAWAFGRKFHDGASVDFNAEPTLGFMGGIFGSAFCATVDQIFSNIVENETVQRILHHFLYHDFPTIGDDRLFTPAQFPNFAEKGVLSHVESLQLMDAGCAFNVPFTPLMRPEREIDIMIGLDQSAGRDQYLSTNLELAAEYARKFNWPFPDISEAMKVESLQKTKDGVKMSAASMKPLSVCMGSVAEGIPTVMYMSLLRNEKFHKEFDPRTAEFCATSNWVWRHDEVDLLTGLTQFNTRQSMDQIKRVLKTTLQHKIANAGKPKPVRTAFPQESPRIDADANLLRVNSLRGSPTPSSNAAAVTSAPSSMSKVHPFPAPTGPGRTQSQLNGAPTVPTSPTKQQLVIFPNSPSQRREFQVHVRVGAGN
jgi:phospholipase A2